MEEYKIRLGASAYFDKGILTEDDLKEISISIENYNKIDEEILDYDESETIIYNRSEE